MRTKFRNRSKCSWRRTLQQGVETCRATRTNGLMQAIISVPVFEGNPGDLEFFLKRVDLIVDQLRANPQDEATNNYYFYFYSGISLDEIMEAGITYDTEWAG